MEQLSAQAKYDRERAQVDLYYLNKVILGYNDMVPHVHGDACIFYTHPKYGRFRQITFPRSWFKTVTMTVGGCIWFALPDEQGIYKDIFPFKGPNVRILLASNISDNAAKMVNMIKAQWEANDRLRAAFPDLIPEFNKTRWSDHCAQLKRTLKATEGTYTSVGAGGGVISQHFDVILEDDLIYAKKDDFTGQELMPTQEDIENAIGWHKLAFSLLVDPKKSCIYNIGTRWAPHDIIDYIRTNETHYSCFEVAATEKDESGQAIWPIEGDEQCIWPERYDKEALDQIRATQGAKIFETQYLNRPRAGEDVTFDASYLSRHDTLEEYPEEGRYETFVDLAGWSDNKKMARNVILTGKKDSRNHLWVARYDAGRFNPSEVIALFKEHQKQFNSRVKIEEVQYQRSIRHFAKLDMENEGDFYDIDPLPFDGRKDAKNLRIRGLEPIVRCGAVHVLRSMQKLINEMEDYPYSNTVDILDCLTFLHRYGKVPTQDEKESVSQPFSVESIEEELYERAGSRNTDYPFQCQLSKEFNVVMD